MSGNYPAWRHIMKNYIIEKENLVAAMEKLSTVSGKKFVAIKPLDLNGKQHLKIAACNEQLQVEDYVPCQSKEVESLDTYFVDATLVDICKVMVGSAITLQIQKSELVVKNGSAVKICLPLMSKEKNSLMVEDIREIENMDEHPTQEGFDYQYTVGATMLQAALHVFGGVTGEYQGTFTLNGAFVEVDEPNKQLVIASTEGHSVAKGTIRYIALTSNIDKMKGSVMPADFKKVVTSFVASADSETNAMVTMQQKLMYVAIGSSLAYFRMKKTMFPPLEQLCGILVQGTEAKATVDTRELINAIKLIELATDSTDKSNGTTPIRLIIKDENLIVQSKNGGSMAEIDAKDVSGESETLLSNKFLNKLISVMPGQCIIEIKDKVATNGAVVLNGFAFLLPISDDERSEETTEE